MEERIVSKMDDALNLIMQRVQDSLEVKLGLKTAEDVKVKDTAPARMDLVVGPEATRAA